MKITQYVDNATAVPIATVELNIGNILFSGNIMLPKGKRKIEIIIVNAPM